MSAEANCFSFNWILNQIMVKRQFFVRRKNTVVDCKDCLIDMQETWRKNLYIFGILLLINTVILYNWSTKWDIVCEKEWTPDGEHHNVKVRWKKKWSQKWLKITCLQDRLEPVVERHYAKTGNEMIKKNIVRSSTEVEQDKKSGKPIVSCMINKINHHHF